MGTSPPAAFPTFTGQLTQSMRGFHVQILIASSQPKFGQWGDPKALVEDIVSPVLSLVCVEVLVSQPCPTLCDPRDRSPPGSSVHGILQARILEWVAIPLSRGSSRPRDGTRASHIAGRFFTV